MVRMRHTWVDTHVHLDRYELAERAAIVARASDAGVAILAVAVDLASSRAVVELDGTAGCAVGVHPLQAAELDAGVLRKLAGMPGVVAIGECGFDGAGPEWAAQASAFRGQCDLAREAGLPVILHIDVRRVGAAGGDEERWRPAGGAALLHRDARSQSGMRSAATSCLSGGRC